RWSSAKLGVERPVGRNRSQRLYNRRRQKGHWFRMVLAVTAHSEPDPNMFFQTSENRLHAGRIGGVLYLIGIAPECIEFHGPHCFAEITFIAGWWLCFGAKKPKRSFREMRHPLEIIGLMLT